MNFQAVKNAVTSSINSVITNAINSALSEQNRMLEQRFDENSNTLDIINSKLEAGFEQQSEILNRVANIENEQPDIHGISQSLIQEAQSLNIDLKINYVRISYKFIYLHLN